MSKQALSWESIVDTVFSHGNSGAATDAAERGEPMPLNEVYVLEDDLDDSILVGTEEGEVELTEDQVVYADGGIVVYEDDDHRETIVLAVMPDYIADQLRRV